MTLDMTHDPALTSWVESANDPETDFPIQNLPFGVFRRRDTDAAPRVGVAIGDQIVDLTACLDARLLDAPSLEIERACARPRLNELMSLGRPAASTLRNGLSNLLRESAESSRAAHQAARILIAMRDAELVVPAEIGDYTDFYASIHHATNVGSMFRPDNPLLPNYKWVPIGYHGRASSIVPSGTNVRRPRGQTRDGNDGPPIFGPSRRMDYELEVGAFVSRGNALGEPVSVDDAEDHVFALCLVNDWSARDIQSWEYQPLGPFLSKSFATSVSPWAVTLDALAPFRAPLSPRSDGDPAALPHLSSRRVDAGGFDIALEVYLSTAQMREAHVPRYRVSAGRFTDMYWTTSQLVAHHTSNGCNLRPGDLLASGTVSGPSEESRGCLLERTWRGTKPLELPTGETRAFLQDGDEVTLRGWCEAPDRRRIGFGECVGRVVSA
ncbi:MAG: fumarylacetoacetase [Gemmatimonadaceae bacterium]